MEFHFQQVPDFVFLVMFLPALASSSLVQFYIASIFLPGFFAADSDYWPVIVRKPVPSERQKIWN